MKKNRATGTFIVTTTLEEKVEAFVPKQLPPIPAINVDQRLSGLLVQAENNLQQLNIAARLLPDVNWFIYAFVRKEAVLSSQIEGTQATLEDVLDYEANSKGGSSDDVQEVCNYITALNYTVKEIRSKNGLPLSLRMLREAHKRLLKGGRGKHKSPGEFRKSQNWIGGTRPGNATFVPPPPDQLKSCLSDFEKYMHSTNGLPALIRIGLCHVQFETIHPFLDGNGRIGRLLILLMMLQNSLLEEPILYLSLYFKKHRKEYYRLLQEVRTTGDWESWLAYYLEGISVIAKETAESSQNLYAVFQKDRSKLINSRAATVPSIRLMELLPSNPIVTLPRSVKLLKTSKPTALKSIRILEDTGILKETTGSKKNKKYAYAKYLDILKADTEID